MKLSYKFQLLPSKSQAVQLEKFLHIGRDFWNYIVELDQKNYSDTGKSYSAYDLHDFIKDYRKVNNNAELLHVHLYQKLCTRYTDAKSVALRKWKRKESERFEPPKVKEHELLRSLTFKQYKNGCKISGNKVRFNKLNIRFNKHCEIEGEIKTVQIKRITEGRFELIVVSEVEKDFTEVLKPSILDNYPNCVRIIKNNRTTDTTVVGIDVGLEKLATLSTGKVYENPRHLKKHEAKLKELKEKKKRQVKGSKRQKKTEVLFQKKHEKVRNCRRDYLHKISKEIVLTCDTIVVEDLNIKQMQMSDGIYSRVKKSMSDASWGILFFMLKYKSSKYNKQFATVDPKYTTQECSCCGNIQKKELGEREHNCISCGEKMDRDLNSAIVIRNRYLKGKEPALR